MTLRSVLVLAAVSTTLLHCSMPADVKATEQTSQDIKGQSQHIATTSDDILNGARKDISDERLNERWTELMNAPNDTERVKAAREFCSYFKFQTWTGQAASGDTVARLRQFQADSMLIFFGQIDGLINGSFDVNEAIPDHRWKVLASIAVGMSELDEDYVAAAKANGIKPDSIYSMIVDGLGDQDQANAGKTIPGSAQNVLNKYADSVFLLQLRHNYSTAIVVNNFTGLLTSFWLTQASDKLGFLSPILPTGLVGEVVTKISPSSLKVDLSTSEEGNTAKIQEDGIDYLTFVTDTQAALQKLGIQLEFNDTIMTIFTQLEFVPPQAEAMSKGQATAVTELNDQVALVKGAYANSRPPAQISDQGQVVDQGQMVGP